MLRFIILAIHIILLGTLSSVSAAEFKENRHGLGKSGVVTVFGIKHRYRWQFNVNKTTRAVRGAHLHVEFGRSGRRTCKLSYMRVNGVGRANSYCDPIRNTLTHSFKGKLATEVARKFYHQKTVRVSFSRNPIMAKASQNAFSAAGFKKAFQGGRARGPKIYVTEKKKKKTINRKPIAKVEPKRRNPINRNVTLSCFSTIYVRDHGHQLEMNTKNKCDKGRYWLLVKSHLNSLGNRPSFFVSGHSDSTNGEPFYVWHGSPSQVVRYCQYSDRKCLSDMVQACEADYAWRGQSGYAAQLCKP